MSTLYPEGLATVSRPFITLDDKWLASESLANKKTIYHERRKLFFFACFFKGWAVISPVGPATRQ